MNAWTKTLLITAAVALRAMSATAQVQVVPAPAPPAAPDAPAVVEPAEAPLPAVAERRLQELELLAQAAAGDAAPRAAVAQRAQEERAAQAAAEADAARQRVRAFAVAAPGAKREKAAFLGVTTSPVPASLRQQLKLQKGLGLVVETIEKDSPADQAGVQQYDVLQKLNDQILVNSQQLGVLVRTFRAGDQITIAGVRQGQPFTATAKLIEKEVAVMDDFMGQFNVVAPAIQGMNNVPLPPLNGQAMVQLRGGGAWGGGGQNLWLNRRDGNDGVTVYEDDDARLEITEHDNEKHLLAKDKDGKNLFEGPIETDDQRKDVPADVMKKLDRLEAKVKTLHITPGSNVTIRVHNDEDKDTDAKDKDAKEEDKAVKEKDSAKKSSAKPNRGED